MYLKTLELTGFKSFADRTRLEFHPGTTAIVGPNGCGKSNVLDAIRWVLGEQSAKALRGSEMADVIFSGTESRKAISLAQVSLTFTDCEEHLGTEFHEVTVTRRVYRDGTGEYELNGTRTRLRDILALFMDTGIGTDAYSIMEQGKIAKIISAKPEDRREIFEEAAGITKYKSQKRDALRKLEQTEANLLRLSDIIKENQRRVNSLQRQASKAKRYQELFHALRDKETILARHQYAGLRDRLAVLEGDAARINGDMQSIAGGLHEGERVLQEARDRADALGREADAARQLKAEQTAALGNARNHLEFNQQRLADLDKADEFARGEISTSTERLKELSVELEKLEADLAESERELAGKQQQHQQDAAAHQEAAARVRSQRDELQRKSTSLAQLEASLASLQQELAGWDLQKRTHLLRAESARSERAGLVAAIDENATARAALEGRRQSAREAVQQARDAVSAAATGVRDARQALDQARREREGLDRSQVQLTSQLETLQRLQQAGEGLSDATREVLKAAAEGRLENVQIAGTLADLIDVAPGCTAAVERLLGHRLQTLLVADAAAARGVAAFLDGRKTDRVTMAFADAPRIAWQTADREESLLRQVTCRGAAEPLAGALFGNAYVVDHLDAALALKAELPHATIVTRDGRLVAAEGLIETGAAGTSGSLLSRREEIESLGARVAEASAQSEAARERERVALESVQAAESALESARGAVLERESTLNAVERDLAVASRQEADARARAQSVDAELARLSEAGEQSEKREAEQFTQREGLLVQRVNAEREVESLKQLSERAAQEEADYAAKVGDLRVALASLQEKRNGLAAQALPARARITELRKAVESREVEIAGNATRRTAIHRENESLTERVAGLEKDLAGADAEIESIQQRRGEVLKEIEGQEAALRDSRARVSALQEQRATCEIELNRVKMEADHLAEHMLRQYQVQADQLLLPFDDGVNYDWDLLRAEVADMRQRLDAMGSVNLDAIAEYEDLEQRLAFLTGQEKDALDAKAQITEAIARINATTQKLFAETFEAIRTNFAVTFQELFGGGRASLTLSDESNPLECGIDIMAKPPGKEPKSITLLSGGEQTMTAVSLLFAIYMVKPSPFCVLDEMDAPLDESNINRFLKMLDQFKSQSQFVLITHNKRTISFADAIYGVTMPERGVSRTASVRFSQSDDKRAPGGGLAPAVSESMGKPLDASAEGQQVALPG